MKYVDLHVHSTASDGTLTPSEVVERAASLSLAAIALTDHDTTNGVAEAKRRAGELAKQGTKIEVYSGVEISAAYKKRDIHILGLFVDESNELLNRTLEAARHWKPPGKTVKTETYAFWSVLKNLVST